MNTKIKWLEAPKKSNYPAALSYLSLIYSRKEAKRLVRALKKTKPAVFKAKDVFRASGLSLLGISNSHVVEFQRKIRDGEELSPILLVRDLNNGKVIIADGYHRMCATYSFCEDETIPCRIV